MGFCTSEVMKDNIFVLTLDAGDGHNYLTLQRAKELVDKLKDIRRRGEASSFKGLITNAKPRTGGAFSLGIDYDNMEMESADAVNELAYLVAEAARELYNMPFPTVAAVTGKVRTSLAMALVFAHDEIAATKDAVFEVTEVRYRKELPPPYLASMLRDRAQYSGMRTAMVLRSKQMTLSDMHYWEVFEPTIAEDDADGLKIGQSIIRGSFGDVHDGNAFVTTRKSFFPEAFKAVSDFLTQ